MTLFFMSPIIRWFFLRYLYLEKKNKYNYIHRMLQIILSIFKALQSKFISMLAFWDKLVTFIELNARICSWNKKLPTNACITLSRSTNTFLRFHSNISINKIINTSLSFNSHTCLNNSVFFSRDLFLKRHLWWLLGSLKVFSQVP